MGKTVTATIGIIVASNGDWYALGYPLKEGTDLKQMAVEAADIGINEEWTEVSTYTKTFEIPVPEAGQYLSDPNVVEGGLLDAVRATADCQQSVA